MGSGGRDSSMHGMVLHAPAPVEESPLRWEEVERPRPGAGEVVVQVEACGVCRTDLHVTEGELPPVRPWVIPGHQVVGRVVETGAGATRFREGDRVGIAWLRHTDGTCQWCREGRENLCPNARFTGYMENGGYAEFAAVPQEFAYRIRQDVKPLDVAPFLCAGIIGYRAFKLSGVKPGQKLGMYGFGASAHVTIQVARHFGCEVYVVTRGERHRALAREMGATWVADGDAVPPVKLDGAIIFAPAGSLVPVALEALDRGGTLAVAGIYMSQSPPLDYERHLFYERTLRSVTANTREDGAELLALARDIPLRTHVEVFPMEKANEALQRLKHDEITGAAVVLPPGARFPRPSS